MIACLALALATVLLVLSGRSGDTAAPANSSLVTVTLQAPVGPNLPAYVDNICERTAIIVGTVDLQGRSNKSGIIVSIETSLGVTNATTSPNGRYGVALVFLSLPGFSPLAVHASMPGYLSGTRTGMLAMAQFGTSVPTVTLFGGDVDRDNDIDNYDLTLVGANFGLPTPPGDARADINGDGAINIYDLVLVGINYNSSGPGPWPGEPTYEPLFCPMSLGSGRS